MGKHYDPAKDPEVINGVQEAYGFKRGDKVIYTNPNGCEFTFNVTGFREPEKRTHTYTKIPSGERVTEEIVCSRTVYIDSNSPWFPVDPARLRKVAV
jgi:hypothetical protein